jgi:hypothetical protein
MIDAGVASDPTNYRQPIMRQSASFGTLIGVAAAVLALLLFVHPLHVSQQNRQAQEKRAQIVHDLQLTDLCLFTEARYTRHLSQADGFAPFQDHPMAFEHFPSGSLVKPPEHLFKSGK